MSAQKKETCNGNCRSKKKIYINQKGVNCDYRTGTLKNDEKRITKGLQKMKRFPPARPSSMAEAGGGI